MFYEPCFSPTKKVIKAITFNDSFSLSKLLFLKLGLLKLDDIFMLQLASFVYACIDRLAPPVLEWNYIKIKPLEMSGCYCKNEVTDIMFQL